METTKSKQMPEVLGDRLRRLRTSKRLAVKEMASLLNVPVATYRDWESGRAIQGEPYSRIAEVLDVGLYELLEGKSREPDRVLKCIQDIESNLAELKKVLRSLF